MFKKQIILVLAFGLLCTLLIGYSIINVSSSSDSFSGSGYVHVTSNESSDKRILFDSGTAYKKKVGGQISFSDSLGDESNVDEKNFIHYDDSSLSSFVNGVLVDLNDLSSGSAMNHYAIPANTILTKNNSSYSVLNSSDNLSFKDFIWKVDEGKYIFVSPSMSLRISDGDERTISGYAEISYLGDGKKIIQIQTEDNIWQTISEDCHLKMSNGIDVNLSNRDVETSEDTVLLDFSRIVINSEDNMELSPITGGKRETVIPHFDITAEDGADGFVGVNGENGTAGQSGTNGQEGNGGAIGADGPDGEAGINEGVVLNFPVFLLQNWTITANECSGDIIVTETLKEGEQSLIQPDDETYIAYIKVFDLETGEVILENGGDVIDRDTYDFTNTVTPEVAANLEKPNDAITSFHFSGLKSDHSYMLQVSAPTNIGGGADTYMRPYITKNFWTDSIGIYMEEGASTTETLSISINKQLFAKTNKAKIYLFDRYEDAFSAELNVADQTVSPQSIDGVNGVITGDEEYSSISSGNSSYLQYTFTLDEISVPGIHSNQSYFARLAVDLDSDGDAGNHPDGLWDLLTNQILEVKTLKAKPNFGAAVLSSNQDIFGFNITPSAITDNDNSFYKYEFQIVDEGYDAAPEDKKKDHIVATIESYDKTGTISISLSGSSVDHPELIKTGEKYRVRTIIHCNDNQKDYIDVPHNADGTEVLSNEAILYEAIKPNVYFVGTTKDSSGNVVEDVTGTRVDIKQYDTITGFVHITRGTGELGAKLVLPSALGQGIESPTLTVRKDGYYNATYVVVPSTHPYAQVGASIPSQYDGVLLATTAETGTNAGEVTITLPDQLYFKNQAGSSALSGDLSGLQADSSYELIVNGCIQDENYVNGTPLPFVEVGRCLIHTAGIDSVAAMWQELDPDGEGVDALQGAKFKLVDNETDANQFSFNRQMQALSQVTIEAYEKEVTSAQFRAGTETPSYTLTFDRKTQPEKFNEMLTNVENGGLTITSNMFSSGANEAFLKDECITLRVSAAYDYTIYDENRANQEDYLRINEDGKIRDSNNNYYYVNSYTPENEKLVNKFTTKDGVKEACYIRKAASINSITAQNWEVLKYDPYQINNTDLYVDSYLMKAYYPNESGTAAYLTYYAYDAIDFFGGNNASKAIQGSSQDDDGNYTEFTYNGKVYPANSDMLAFVTNEDRDNKDDLSSKALTYRVPTNLGGLELAKGRFDIDEETVYVRFFPMTTADYRKYTGSTARPQLEENGKTVYCIYYPDTIDASKNSIRGHQFVFAWTMECKVDVTEEDTYYLVYPFDSRTFNANKIATLYETYAANEGYALANDTAFKDGETILSPYLRDKLSATVGLDAYMLIPHSTFYELPEADLPKELPLVRSLQWASSDEAVTMRTYVFDNDGSVNVVNDNPNTIINNANVFALESQSTGIVRSISTSASVPVVRAGNIYSDSNFNAFLDSDKSNFLNDLQNNEFIYRGLITKTSDRTTEIDGFNISSTLVTPYKYNDLFGVVTSRSKKSTPYSNTNSNAIGELQVQCYNNDYVQDDYSYNRGMNLFTNDGTSYVTGSYDGNWTLSNSNNGKYLDKYTKLFVTTYNDAQRIDTMYVRDLSREGAEKPEASFIWYTKPETGQTEEGQVIMKINNELLTKIAGVRLYFYYQNNGLGEDDPHFTLDKMLPGIDAYTKELGKSDVATVSDAEQAGYKLLRFKFNIADELSKETYTEYVINSGNDRGDSKIVTTKNLLTLGGEPVRVAVKLLVPSFESGYSLISDFDIEKDSEGNEKDLYTLDTFALKGMTNEYSELLEDHGSIYNYYDSLYYTFDLKDSQQITSVSDGKALPANYPLFGSFFKLKIDKNEPKLNAISSRKWQFNDDRYSTRITIGIDPIGESRKIFIPIKLEESAAVDVKTYDQGANPYSENPEHHLPPRDDGGIILPGIKPVISYSNGKKSTNALSVKFNYSSSTEDELYFTFSKEMFDSNGVAKLYKLSDHAGGTLGEIDAVSFEIDPNVYESKKISGQRSSSTTYDPNDSNFAPIKDYMVKLSSTNDMISFYKLAPNTEYFVSCWTYQEVDPINHYYGFERVDMLDINSLRIPNIFMMKTNVTPSIPEIKAIYYSYSENQKYMKIQPISFKDFAYDPNNNYIILELRKGEAKPNGGSEFVTYLYSGSTINTTRYFDLDGTKEDAVISGWGSNSNKLLYKYDENDPKMENLNGLCELTYEDLGGFEYFVIARAYENGKGPLYVQNYDFDVDADSLFVDVDNNVNTTFDGHCYLNNDNGHTIDNAVSTDLSKNSKISLTDVSYMTFGAPRLRINSGSLYGPLYSFAAILKHTDSVSKETKYYDITRFIINEDGSSIDSKYAFPFSNKLYRLNITKKLSGSSYEFDQIIDAKDEVTIVYYAHQAGIVKSISGVDHNVGVVDGSIINKTTNFSYQKIFDPRTYVPKFTGSDTIYDESFVITAEQYTELLSDKVDGNNNIVSRVMGKVTNEVPVADVNAGTVKVTAGGRDYTQLYFQLELEHPSSPELINKLKFGYEIETAYEDENGQTKYAYYAREDLSSEKITVIDPTSHETREIDLQIINIEADMNAETYKDTGIYQIMGLQTEYASTALRDFYTTYESCHIGTDPNKKNEHITAVICYVEFGSETESVTTDVYMGSNTGNNLNHTLSDGGKLLSVKIPLNIGGGVDTVTSQSPSLNSFMFNLFNNAFGLKRGEDNE